MKKEWKKVLATVLSCALTMGMTACGSSETASTTSATTTGASNSTEAVTASAKAEKELVVGNGKLSILDGPACTDNVTSAVLLSLYCPLFTYSENSEMVPVAVDTYEISADGLVYTFNLRKDMKWSDGEPVTAHDYEFGMKRSLGYGPAAISADLIGSYVLNAKEPWLNFADVSEMDEVGIKSVDDYTLEITLEQATAFFLPLLVRNVFLPARADIATEHSSEWALSTEVPTNGAFMLSELNEGGETVLVKNPNYFDAENVNLDRLVFTAMDDMNAQLLAFQNGDIDVALSVDVGSAKAVYDGQPELVIPSTIINYYIQLNVSEEYTTCEALLDENVRRALAMGTSREDIILALDAEDMYKPIYGMVPYGIPGEDGFFREEQDAKDFGIKTDVEAAKALMEAAGYTKENPLKLTYTYNGSTMNDTFAVVLQSQWAEIGVDLEISSVEAKIFYDERDTQGIFEVARSGYYGALLDPYNHLEMFVSTHQGAQVFVDERVDSLITESSSEVDVHTRMEQLKEAEAIIVEENVWTIPMFSMTNPYLVSTKVSGINFVPSGTKYFTYADITE